MAVATGARHGRRRQQLQELLASFAQEVSSLERCTADEAEEWPAEMTTGAACELDRLNGCHPLSPEVARALGDAFGAMGGLLEAAEEARPKHAWLQASVGVAGEGAATADLSSCDWLPGRLDGGHDRGRGEEKAIWTSGVVQAMMQDHTIMRCNLHDYELALRAATSEVGRLLAEVSHLDGLCAELSVLQELVEREKYAQEELNRENAALASRSALLVDIARSALEAEGDVERDAFIDALVSENTMLWRLTEVSRAVRQAPTTQVPQPPRRGRLSLGGRSARSSTTSSTSLASPEGRSFAAAAAALVAVREPAPAGDPSAPGADEASSGREPETYVAGSRSLRDGERIVVDVGEDCAKERASASVPRGSADLLAGAASPNVGEPADDQELFEAESLVTAIFLGTPPANDLEEEETEEC